MFKKIKKFFNDVVAEMKKVSWPTRDQLRESTRVVILFTLIVTLFIFIIDQITTWIVQLIY
ncbi:MAG TPA: preprotein translocase subunit SecE [Candidatus Kapabacteria bacterium]|nr:preprotein translocase subunit SecE [Candidatus Kapabacteria bacterium]HOV92488.1 preprotein translocase subunit SecE [Candidatus Kapabacteria bacterium]